MLHFYFCSWGRHKHNIKFNEHEQYWVNQPLVALGEKSSKKERNKVQHWPPFNSFSCCYSISRYMPLCKKSIWGLFYLLGNGIYQFLNMQCQMGFVLLFIWKILSSISSMCGSWGFKWVVTATKTSH